MGSGATRNVLEENKNGENEYVKYDLLRAALATAVRDTRVRVCQPVEVCSTRYDKPYDMLVNAPAGCVEKASMTWCAQRAYLPACVVCLLFKSTTSRR